MALKEKLTMSVVPIALAVAILAVMGLIVTRDDRRLSARKEDTPPRIEFTWSPAGPVSLREMKGFLTINDDYGIDFTTYRMRLPELDKTLDMPIDGLIGKDYEQPISFSLLADNPKLAGHDRLTVEISVADDRGQKSTLTRVIMLKTN
ncbi:MAG TPA: hypothetical protein VL426_03515 [Candidatus Binatia bacterium]|jgi:hypothetical protein|nr:hypothetical protein [Candidatus Binatia bacterium]